MVDTKAYNALLEGIFERFPSVQKDGFSAGAYKPGLERMRAFDEALGCPSKKVQFVHVGGTNGKGSVSSMLTAALAASRPGARVGLYTSPHLWDFRERIKIISIDGGCEEIPQQAVYDFLVKWSDTFNTIDLSFFEITTGMALWWFANQNVDWAVMEVGLGGRLDSTNIIVPKACVITSIGLDHCALLGNTRSLIAREKAGIFKKGVPAIVSAYDSETAKVFVDCAAAAGAELIFADRRKSCSAGCVESAEPLPDVTALDLQGPCQDINLRSVLRTLEALGLDADMNVINRTAELTDFHGRWEKINIEGHELICDIGHNPPALTENFRKLSLSNRPLTIVYGIMADKDLSGIIPLMPGMGTNEAPAGVRYLFCAPSTPRAMDAATLTSRFAAYITDNASAVSSSNISAEPINSVSYENAGSVANAVKVALAESKPDSLIYIGGSTFVVSEAGEILKKV